MKAASRIFLKTENIQKIKIKEKSLFEGLFILLIVMINSKNSFRMKKKRTLSKIITKTIMSAKSIRV